MPVSKPVDEPIEALVLLLLQVPPGVASDRVDELPGHTVSVPVMVAGNGFTITVAVV